MISYASAVTFRGQLQRGRGIAARRAPAERGADAVVYECVIRDPRWDRQTDDRAGYLAGLIRDLDLSLAPVEQHLATFDGEDAEGVGLALDVLALLPLAGRRDAAPIVWRYAARGKHWQTVLESITGSGAWQKFPELWDGLGADIAASHDDDQLKDAIWVAEPWATFARSQPRIRRLLEEARALQRPTRPVGRPPGWQQKMRGAPIEALLAAVAAGGPERRRALAELGRLGEDLVLDLAEDPGLRNAAGWIPGMSPALRSLGPTAVQRARRWAQGADSMLAQFGEQVLAEHGQDRDIPVLLAALQHAADDQEWGAAEVPARGLGRLRAVQAAGALASAWENTVHSRAREAFLDGLRGCAPQTAGTFAEEGLYDCEPTVRDLACEGAPDSKVLRTRLRELAQDPLTLETRDAATTRLTRLLTDNCCLHSIRCGSARPMPLGRVGRD